MKNFVARGDVVEITAGADITSGAVVVMGALIGIAVDDIANGETGQINLTGVYDVPKTGSQAWTVGAAVYWDAGNGEATTTVGDNAPLGVAVKAVGSGADEEIGRVRLNNGVVPPKAAFVEDASSGSGAEINALRDALIAAGLMEPDS